LVAAVAPLVGTFYEGLEGVEAPTKNSVQRGVERIAAWHASLADKGWFSTVIILLFALDALFLLVVVGFVSVYSTMETVDITDWIVVVAAAAEALLIVYGLFRLRSARIRTYTAFRYGLLVSILIARVFSFYDDPIDALCWLAVDLLLLWSLDRMVEQERRQSVQFQG